MLELRMQLKDTRMSKKSETQWVEFIHSKMKNQLIHFKKAELHLFAVLANKL